MHACFYVPQEPQRAVRGAGTAQLEAALYSYSISEMHIIMLTAQYCIDYLILCASVDFLIALDLNQRFLLHKNRFVSVKVFSTRVYAAI